MTRRSVLLLWSSAAAFWTALVPLAFAACGGADGSADSSHAPNDGGSFDGAGPGFGDAPSSEAPCTANLCARRAACPPAQDTTLVGTVYDPAGKVPLPDAVVYIPNDAVPPMLAGASCDRCTDRLVGSPVPGTIAISDVEGNFTMHGVPTGDAIPLVIQVGKWRRQITLPNVPACTTTALGKEMTRLPRVQAEGNIPHIAITTGAYDSLECLPLRMGVDPSEFTVKGRGTGRIHLYAGYGLQGDSQHPTVALDDGTQFPQAQDFWSKEENLDPYDAVLLSCEGSRNADGDHFGTNPYSKPPSARAALYQYLDRGGRVYASHLHDVWFRHPEDEGYRAAQWDSGNLGDSAHATINTSFFKGQRLHDWMQYIGALDPDGGTLALEGSNGCLGSISPVYSTAWIEVPPADIFGTKVGGGVSLFSFNTPLGASEEAQCGRVAYTDLHVSYGAAAGAGQDKLTGGTFPSGQCVMRDLTPQEKAMEFLLFDISSCVTSDRAPPPPPH